jgi:hypothetical protein
MSWMERNSFLNRRRLSGVNVGSVFSATFALRSRSNAA